MFAHMYPVHTSNAGNLSWFRPYLMLLKTQVIGPVP